MSSNTVIVRKRGGLSGIGNIQGGFKEYRQQAKDRDKQGVYVGEYREPSLPQSKHYLAPMYSELSGQWSWGGTMEELAQCVKNLKLRHERGDLEGKLIDIKDVDITNLHDTFFSHSKLYANKYLDGGRLMLNLNVPLDNFYYLNMKGSRAVHDKTNPKNQVFAKGAEYELINPKTVNAKLAKDAKKEVGAIIALSQLDYSTQKLIAEIMDLTVDLKDPDPDSLFIALKDQAAENTEIFSRYGNKSAQQRFLDLVEFGNEDLSIMSQIIRGKKARILVHRGSYFQFNMGQKSDLNTLNERIEGVQTDGQLINFFRKEGNIEYYLELAKMLEAFENGNISK